MPEYAVHLPKPHEKQAAFIASTAKRKVIRAGRRGGKTVGIGVYAVEKFLAGRRLLYAAPTADQVGRFWVTVTRALSEPIDAGIFRKNETEHIVELPGTEQRIRAKTAWNADTLRSDYADDLIFDEWQLIDEDAWEVVGAPMLLDNNGDATFIYTPHSLHSRSVSKARDPQHAAKMFKMAAADTTGRWAAFHFTSMDNPYISKAALGEITKDMTSLSYRMEILAEDVNEAPGALWTRDSIEKNRVFKTPDFSRVVVGVDPTATSGGDEAGIITAGRGGEDCYTLADDSTGGSPQTWAKAAVTAYYRHKADLIVAEKNNGGEMVEAVIKQVDPKVRVKLVWASRGKSTRAEPISAMAEQGRDHHVGSFAALEDELCLWIPGDDSPNRLDAKVWAYTELMDTVGSAEIVDDPFAGW
ncbi:MAG: phage terminase large subunit family protein [Saccharofermentanales bacterium]